MERKIMFRGKHISSRNWLYGNLLVSADGTCYISQITTFENVSARQFRESIIEVHPETVGQLTGLKDKTGHDIYEDDIITSDDIHTRAIKWNSYECKFNAVEWGIDKAIILGNIHDNPELLKSDDHE